MRQHVIVSGDQPVSTIVVGRGINDALADIVGLAERSRIAVFSQQSTRAFAEACTAPLQDLGVNVSSHCLPDREEAKTMQVVEHAYALLNDAGFTRDDLVIAVGGGALTDVAGFVAATYLRGVSVIYVSTTLIGAVDASIGGKTGINVGGKNLVGAFSHPEAVLIDVDILDTLPIDLKREGAAEALKTGFIEDMAVVDAYEASGLDVDLEDVVNRCVAVKAAVVNDDFTEQGRRAILNYGHTIGHAIETVTGASHAESVSMGMVAAGAASRTVFGFNGEERQQAILDEVGLPTSALGADGAAVRSQMAKDKKRDAAGMRMVLLREFGIPEVVHVDDATVESGYRAIGLA